MKQLATWRYLWSMISYRPWLYLRHALLWGTNAMSWFLAGLLAQTFFNLLTGQSTLHLDITGVIALMVALAVGRVMVWFGAGSTEILMRFHMSSLLRRNLLIQLLKRPGALALPYSIGEVISRLRDDAYQGEDGVDWSDEITVQGIFAVLAFLVLLRIDPLMTLVVMLPLIVVTIIVRQASTALTRYRAASSQATSQVTGAISDILAAVPALQAAGAEERVVERFRRLNEQRRKAMLTDRLATQYVGAITENAVSLGTGLIMLLAAGKLRGGNLSVGDFALFIAYLSFIADFTTSLGQFLAHYRQTGVAFTRMNQLLEDRAPKHLVEHSPLYLRGALPEITSPVARREQPLQFLEVRGLTYHHAQSGQGISGIDLRLARGSLTVVTGRIGAGKSTLLQVLLGLLPAEEGEIYWNGQRIEQPVSFFVPPHAAYTPQVPRLFSETLKENILLGLPKDAVSLSKAIHTAMLEQDIQSLEAELETPVGTRGVRLSGGQVQRTAAARMLVRPAELLVIDDLSSALDVETEQAMWERLFARPDLTCLAVSHRRSALQRADQIILLKDGRIEAQGTWEELIARHGEMNNLWEEEVESVN